MIIESAFMVDTELIAFFENEINKGIPIEFPEFLELDALQAVKIADLFASKALIKLPKREIDFFEWLKVHDFQVWEDLWGGEEDEPYVVGISFLPILADKLRGFPICDLVSSDNYYFTEECIIEEEAKLFRDSSQERFINGNKLTLEQAFIVEVCAEPIDIWRFAYRYKVDINKTKAMVEKMAEEKLILHVRDRNQLAGLIKI